MLARWDWVSVDFGRRAVALCALVGFLVGTTGLPLPRMRLPGKDRSQPFPCQDRACGCASAEQCWRGCCCFTNREKLAWAAEHGVTPPDYVFAAAQREKPVAKIVGCCASQQAAACCERATTCSDHDHAADGERAANASPVTIDFVLTIQARKCQGQAELWLALGAVTLPPAKVSPTLESPLCGNALVFVAALSSVSSSPETPPPRA